MKIEEQNEYISLTKRINTLKNINEEQLEKICSLLETNESLVEENKKLKDKIYKLDIKTFFNFKLSTEEQNIVSHLYLNNINFIHYSLTIYSWGSETDINIKPCCIKDNAYFKYLNDIQIKFNICIYMFPTYTNQNINRGINSTMQTYTINFESHIKESMIQKYPFSSFFLNQFNPLYGENKNILFFASNSEKYNIFTMFDFVKAEKFCKTFSFIDK